MIFDELQTKGLVTIPMGCPDIKAYLDSLPVCTTHESWDTLGRENFPPEVIEKVASYLKDDPALSPFTPHIRVQIDRCREGHYQPPHNDLSLFSPFIAQLFILGNAKLSLLSGNTETNDYTMQKVNDGDLLVFYTYPNNFVYSFTEVTGGDIYVIGFLACASVDPYADWIFKDVQKDWPKWT